MAKPAVVIDPAYLKHLPGDSHPERPERIQVLLDLAKPHDRTSHKLREEGYVTGELEEVSSRMYRPAIAIYDV